MDNFTLTSSSGSFTYGMSLVMVVQLVFAYCWLIGAAYVSVSLDHAFDGAANNWDVYEEVGRPIIDAFLQGFNGQSG